MCAFNILDKTLDSEKILFRVKEHVKEKMKDVNYKNDPFLEVLKETKINQESSFSRNPSDSLNQALDKIHLISNPCDFSKITSHRRKVGKYIVFLKKVVCKCIHPITKLILSGQQEFNVQLSVFLRNFLDTFLITRDETLLKIQEDIIKMQEIIKDQAQEIKIREERIHGIQRGFDSLESAYYSITKDLAESLSKRIPEIEIESDTKSINTLIKKANSHFLYHNFNEEFSGSVEFEKELYRPYLSYFSNCKKVLDLGCGRAPFLKLLIENNIGAFGADLNAHMAAKGKKEGLNIQHKDALVCLKETENSSLDGIFMGHLVEHLSLENLIPLLHYSHMKLEDDCYLVFETPNIASLFVLSNAYFKDGTHQFPRHSEFYRFLAEDVGFRKVEIKYSYNVSEEEKLEFFPVLKDSSSEEKNNIEIQNNNIRFLREFLFGKTNVAIIAQK